MVGSSLPIVESDTRPAHRLPYGAWILLPGTAPAGEFSCHSCGCGDSEFQALQADRKFMEAKDAPGQIGKQQVVVGGTLPEVIRLGPDSFVRRYADLWEGLLTQTRL